jgi:tRNA A-37 threonylcarbamoyl transferase component Bud32
MLSNDRAAIAVKASARVPACLCMRCLHDAQRPFINVRRWATAKQSFGAVLHMFDDVAACVGAIHGAGRMHRDLKPANVLWMLQSHCWRIIDLRIAARAGAHARQF